MGQKWPVPRITACSLIGWGPPKEGLTLATSLPSWVTGQVTGVGPPLNIARCQLSHNYSPHNWTAWQDLHICMSAQLRAVLSGVSLFIQIWQNLAGKQEYWGRQVRFLDNYIVPIKNSQDQPSVVRACTLSHFSCVWLSATLWTVASQAPLSMGFSRQEYWSGLPFPPPGDLPDPGIEPTSPSSPALAGGFFTTSATWETPQSIVTCLQIL